MRAFRWSLLAVRGECVPMPLPLTSTVEMGSRGGRRRVRRAARASATSTRLDAVRGVVGSTSTVRAGGGRGVAGCSSMACRQKAPARPAGPFPLRPAPPVYFRATASANRRPPRLSSRWPLLAPPDCVLVVI